MTVEKAKLSVSIDKDLYEKLVKYAEERGISRSAATNRIFSGTLPQIVDGGAEGINSIHEELWGKDLNNDRIKIT